MYDSAANIMFGDLKLGRNQLDHYEMGGGAFERTVKMAREECTRMQAFVNAIPSAMAPDLTVTFPPEVLDKTSFGDVDFLCRDPQRKRP